jgi:hypothetical protein
MVKATVEESPGDGDRIQGRQPQHLRSGQEDRDVIRHLAADVSQVPRHQVIERLVEVFSVERLRLAAGTPDRGRWSR